MAFYSQGGACPGEGACIPGGMHAWGLCMAWGHASQGVMGVCAQGAGMHYQEHACLGSACPRGAYMPREHACQAGGMHPGGVCMACMPPCGLILRDAVSQ